MFGKNIKYIRLSKNIGVNELSRRSGVNASYISALERDEKNNPSVNTLEKLAKALDVSIDDIMRNDLDTSTIEIDSNAPSNNNNECHCYHENGEFKTAEAAMQFILKQPAIMGFGGFNPEDLSDLDIIEFANELLDQYKTLSYKYKFKNK